MSTFFNKKAFSPPFLPSPASTVATESDMLPDQASLFSESPQKPYLASPLLGCKARQDDELPLRRSCSRLRCAISHWLRITLALLVAFALGLCVGCFDGSTLHTLSIFAGHARLRGGSWWEKKGLIPGTRMELTVHNRSVLVYMPWSAISGPIPKPVPAIVVLHGSFDTATIIANSSRFEGVAEAHNPGFLLVYPEMKHYKAAEWGFDEQHDDAFFRDLPNAIATAGFPIDQAKVFVAGHSNGGTMSLYLQNNMPDVFKAAAAVEAGVGHLHAWHDMSLGRPTMVVWNHNDNVLADYGGESLYQKTILQLRRHDPATRFGSAAGAQEWKPVSDVHNGAVYANRLYWPAVGKVPPLTVVSWRSAIPTHNWSNPVNVPGSFDAAAQIWSFFQEVQVDSNE